MDHFLRFFLKYKENPFEYDQNDLNTIQNKILNLIKQNPKIIQMEIAKILGVSREKVKYNIAILKVNNILERIGSNKIGEWKILK